jgi:hypothetical protein
MPLDEIVVKQLFWVMTRQQLLQDISAFCRRRNIAETTFGRLATGNARVVAQLRTGSTSYAVAEKMISYIADNTESIAE